ncbi:MAG: helix-turn-helix transcriptional regulator [Clostridia bacterium]|nr:helix-turn-helix transcriptional regulator [Clostridia bacterium]
MSIMSNKYDLNDFVHTITEQNVLDAIVEKVKTRRKELKLTQQDMAKRSGVSYASIRRFENTGEISFTSLLKIASVLNALADFNLLFNTENVTNLKEY